MLVSAMAYATENIGLAFTSSVFQAHPFSFARQMSTLDHLTKGRVAWNIVTSYLPNAASNFGHQRLPSHEERYDLADEYLEVVYKLWEGSWEENAVLKDIERGIYADPGKVHKINHKAGTSMLLALTFLNRHLNALRCCSKLGRRPAAGPSQLSTQNACS